MDQEAVGTAGLGRLRVAISRYGHTAVFAPAESSTTTRRTYSPNRWARPWTRAPSGW